MNISICRPKRIRGRLMKVSAGYILVILLESILMIPVGAVCVFSADVNSRIAGDTVQTPLLISHLGLSPKLERPPVVFNHDLHTTALKSGKSDDCAVCHVMKTTDARLTPPEARIFKFPKGLFDETDKTAIMYAYHNQCVSCHRKPASEGKKTGPDIGLCGKCHVKKVETPQVSWAWNPTFDYARHNKHVSALNKMDKTETTGIAKNVELVGEVTGKKCELCHHNYDATQKKLIYQKNTENSCRACHKDNDEKNARSMKKVAHAACIECHMKLAEKAKSRPAQQGKAPTAPPVEKLYGPVECKGCHGEHKKLKPDEIVTIPRLDRGQKDMIDLALAADEKAEATPKDSVISAATQSRMKAVPFNHKAHEPRAQFCDTCHHHSLEKCSSCHTPSGDPKGKGVSYEQAFHRARGKQACVACHETAKAETKCAGCHQWMNAGLPSSSCAVCHRGPSHGQSIDVNPAPPYEDKEKVPEKVQIKVLAKEFKPAEFAHLKIVNKLVAISNESSLALRFHAAKDQTLCAGCHHRGDLQQAAAKAPKCVSCHNRSFDPVSLSKPGIMAAYHRQCMGCHTAMKQKPASLDCDKCHAAKEGDLKAGLMRTISESK
jgi:hypothetical protein